MHKSFHFIPADNQRFLARSKDLNADVLIYDLEDAVAAKNKSLARDNISKLSFNGQLNFIRVNGIDSDDFEEDIRLVKSLPEHLGVVLSKTESEDQINSLIKKLGRKTKIIPLIEDFRSLMDSKNWLNHPLIYAASLGVEDLLTDLPYTNDRLDLLIDQLRFELLKNSRAYGVFPIDVISTVTNDSAKFERECSHAKSMGFTAKFSIHPSQVNIINDTFTPAKEDVVWANNILSHSTAGDSGYIMHDDGILTTPPKVKKAKNILHYEK
jgi:citrate lyase subunit beta/citryl-CoA lyase